MKNLRVIIAEDEAGAATNLTYLLKDVSPGIQVLAVPGSVEQTLAWLAEHEPPDLAFFDIQLEDGLSFEIFRKTQINFPVIFTTAYDQYALEAFKVNSIDYLLKPVNEDDLLRSLNKYDQLTGKSFDPNVIERILQLAAAGHRPVTFLVHFKDKLIPVPAADIAYFYIDNGLVHACAHSQQLYPIEHTLDELEAMLSDRDFFRANRQFIIHRKALKDAVLYFNGRLSLNMNPASAEGILISKARVPVFKAWMKGN
jgi:two-component system, LytTR family, response regulator LytT